MPVSFDVQGALADGHSPADITAYLAANPTLALRNTVRGPDPVQYDTAGALKAGLAPETIMGALVPSARPSLDPLLSLNTQPGDGQSTTATPPAAPQTSTASAAQPASADPNSPPPNTNNGDTATAMHHARMNVSGALGAGYEAKEIVNYMAAQPGPVGDATRQAVKWNYSPEEIIDHLNPSRNQEDYQNVPILAPIQRGATAAESGIANLAQDVGLPGVASAIRSHLSQQVADTKLSASNVVDDLKAGNYRQALAAVPSAVLEGALPAGAALAGGAAAGTAGAALAAGGIGALTQGDAIARARAANNGHATPSASDLALGLAGGAGIGALGSIGLPGALASGAEGGLKGAMVSTAAHAAADAAQPQAASLAGSAGTSNGAQLAPLADSEAAALQGVGTKIAMGAPGAVAGMTPGVRNAALSARYNAMNPVDQQFAQNVVAAHQAMQDATTSSVGMTGTPSPKMAAGTASDGIMRGVKTLVGSLQDQGVLDKDGAATISNTMTAARSPGTVLTNDHMAALDGLGLAPDDVKTLGNAAMQMNLLSDPASLQANVGPFQTALQAVGGHAGGALVGGLLGGLHGAGLGYLVGGAVRPATRAVFGGAGSALDGSLGLQKSPLERAADDNRALLQAAGVPATGAADDLAARASVARDIIAAQRGLMAKPLDAVMQTATNRAAAQGVGGDASGSLQVRSGTPQDASDPVAAAVARAAAQSPQATSQSGPEGQSQGTFAPDTSGLSPAALAQAQRLPDWVYGIGASLQDALHKSGQARPVNMMAEVHGALDDLQGKGWLPDDLATGLKGHTGRIIPMLYELIRNEALLRNGIDRTAGGTALMGQTQGQQ